MGNQREMCKLAHAGFTQRKIVGKLNGGMCCCYTNIYLTWSTSEKDAHTNTYTHLETQMMMNYFFNALYTLIKMPT